jgi:hypothetical protein
MPEQIAQIADIDMDEFPASHSAGTRSSACSGVKREVGPGERQRSQHRPVLSNTGAAPAIAKASRRACGARAVGGPRTFGWVLTSTIPRPWSVCLPSSRMRIGISGGICLLATGLDDFDPHFAPDCQSGTASRYLATAVIIAYDDSDGWYDHVLGPILTQSNDPTADALTDADMCGTASAGSLQDRCGFGPRQPLLVVSPFARRNFVDHSTTGQASILRFIEDNWNLGRLGNQSFDGRDASLTGLFDFDMSHSDRHTSRLMLDPTTGQEVH